MTDENSAVSGEIKRKPKPLINMKLPTFGWGVSDPQIVPANADGYETASMTDEDSKPSYNESPRSLKSVEELEEKVKRAQEELTEARARVRHAEQIEDLQVRKQKLGCEF